MTLEDQVPSLRISEFLKKHGRKMMENFTASLRQDIKSLHEKHVRERKNTSRFKAENNNRKTSLIISMRQRRVGPADSTAVNETSEELRRSASLCHSNYDTCESNEKVLTTSF